MNQIYLYIFCILVFISLSFAITYPCDPRISCGCSLSSSVITSRIIGGETAPNNTWGWAVSLQRSQYHVCGAALISYEYALTAAHCIEKTENISRISIVVGTNYILNLTNTTAQRRQIIEYIPHPDFDLKTLINDIALIRFSPLTIVENSTINIICLPADDQDPFAIGGDLVIIGWGVLTHNSFFSYPYLQQATLKAISPTENLCIKVPIRNESTQICAGVNGSTKDTGKGDSGGPIMAFFDDRWVLVGITSSGHGGTETGYPGLYTRVSFFIPFIQTILNNQGITVRSTLRTTRLTTTTQKMTGQSEKISLNKSIIFLLIFFLVIINI